MPTPTRTFTDYHLTTLGQQATWRQYISASANPTGAAVAGFDDITYYREQTITGIFQPQSREGEYQTTAGFIDAGRLIALTPQPLALRDEIVLRGDTWRVESDSFPAPIANFYITHLRKGI